MKVLGIETSCDETAAGIVEDGVVVLCNVVSSQVHLHAEYGGVVPELASRQHIQAIVPVVEEALRRASLTLTQLDAVAVTYGPGLAGALLVGTNFAKALAYALDLPLVPINHLEGHIYAAWLERPDPPPFPLVALIVSGGHSDVVLMENHGRYQRLGETVDDAAGEAFDKVARLLGLGFPGGPAIDRLAATAPPPRLRLPRARLRLPYDFSFSGLKTSVLHIVRSPDPALPAAEVAAAFQESVVDSLVTATLRAARDYGAGTIVLSGGVAANSLLRRRLVQRSPLPVVMPAPALCTDNGAMIAACAFWRLRAGAQTGTLDLDVAPGLRIG